MWSLKISSLKRTGSPSPLCKGRCYTRLARFIIGHLPLFTQDSFRYKDFLIFFVLFWQFRFMLKAADTVLSRVTEKGSALLSRVFLSLSKATVMTLCGFLFILFWLAMTPPDDWPNCIAKVSSSCVLCLCRLGGFKCSVGRIFKQFLGFTGFKMPPSEPLVHRQLAHRPGRFQRLCVCGQEGSVRREQQAWVITVTFERHLDTPSLIWFWLLSHTILRFFLWSSNYVVKSPNFWLFHSQHESPQCFHLQWNLASSSTCLEDHITRREPWSLRRFCYRAQLINNEPTLAT